jgi:P4 family phage/plasmid primase-like protien
MSAVEQLTLLDKVLAPFGTNDRYCRIRKGEKGAFEEGFLENLLTFEELTPWLENGGNYGVIAGQNIIIIDLDDPELADGLPETFTVQSGRGGKHLYLQSDATENGILEHEKENVGHIQVNRKLAVGPGSVHPNGNMYTVEKNVPVAWVSKVQLEQCFGNLLRWFSKEQFDKTAEAEFKHCGIEITKLVDLAALTKRGNEFQGSHPLHGSTTGQNFCVNSQRNVWYCFRHGSGGGPLSWIAVKECLIDCADAQPGALRGDLFKQTLKIAKEKYGYKEQENEDKTPQPDENMESFPNFFTYQNGVKIFRPGVFANYLISRYNFKTTKDDETIYVYDDLTGIYKPEGTVTIKAELTRYLQEAARSRYLTDVLFHVQTQTYFDRPKTPTLKIACKNGLLNLKTYELEPFSPKEFITIRIPVSYTPGVDCPKIKKFLKQIVAEQDVKVLQEITGYCLYPKIPIHKAGLFEGEGANGKSTELNLLKRFLGSENVTSLTLQEICTDKPAKALLYSKLANLCADLPSKTLTNTGVFKTLTGNDNISARELYKNYFTFKNTAKLIFSANEIPQTEDFTPAFFRRWVIVKFPNKFIGNNCNPNILNEIATPTELAGMLNWALEGLKRLLKNGEFTNSHTIEEDRENYLKLSNSPVPYIEKHLESSNSPDDIIPEQMLYAEYCNWCNKNGRKSTRKADFTKTLYQVLPGINQGERTIQKKRVKCYIYLKPSTASTTFASTLLNYLTGGVVKNYNRALAEAGEAGEEFPKNCGHCANFRMPSCEAKDWEKRNGNLQPLTNWCFKPRTELMEAS